MGNVVLSEIKQSLQERIEKKRIFLANPVPEKIVTKFLSEFGVTYPLDIISPPPSVHKVFRQGTICVPPCVVVSCEYVTLASFVTNDINPIWNLIPYQGAGVVVPARMYSGERTWRLIETAYGVIYSTGFINESDGSLTGLPGSFESTYPYNGYMEIQYLA